MSGKLKLSESTHSVHLTIAEACKKKKHLQAPLHKICQEALKEYNIDRDATSVDCYYILRFFYHFFKRAGEIHDLSQPTGVFLEKAAMKAHIEAVTDANKSVFINSQLNF